MLPIIGSFFGSPEQALTIPKIKRIRQITPTASETSALTIAPKNGIKPKHIRTMALRAFAIIENIKNTIPWLVWNLAYWESFAANNGTKNNIPKYAKIPKGSVKGKNEIVGSLTEEQVKEIASIKLPDLNAYDLEAAIKTVKGTALNMGIEIK